MNAKIEKLENNIIQLEITVEAEIFNEALLKSVKKNSKKFDLPGFRKGKAPIAMIKRNYGVEVFYEDAMNFIYEDTYPKVIKENNLNPVDYPELDIVEIGEGKDFIYIAKVAVMPEVILGEYNGVEVSKVEYPVSDEEVDKQIKLMQEKGARVEIKSEDTAVEKGDIAIIDFKGYVDGIAFEGGEGKEFSLEIGSGSFIDNFEDQLIGLKKGEKKEVNVHFPEEYGKEELNGKAAMFEVTVNEIKAKELPDLDDEFAKEVSEFDTLAELKTDMKNKIIESNNLRAEREFEDKVVDAACENAKIDIPAVMIKKETDIMLQELEQRLKYQELDLKSYYQYTNTTEEKVREYMKENAEKRVKTKLVVEEIAKVEKVEATEEELLVKATEYAKQYGDKDIEKMAKLLLDAQKEYIKTDVINEKVIKMLVNNSKTVA
ncbi:MAG: trigger factor [Clostridiaceae bacterium]|nr:trigger factor [Clostridiaceae bacterium]